MTYSGNAVEVPDRYEILPYRMNQTVHGLCAVLRVFAQTCRVIPVQSSRLEDVNVLENTGAVIWLGGRWTQYEPHHARVESDAAITRLNRVDDSRALIELKPEDFVTWLEPNTPLAKLECWLQP